MYNNPKATRRATAYKLKKYSSGIGYLSGLVTGALICVPQSLILYLLAFIATIVWVVLSINYLQKKTLPLINELTETPGDILALVREFHETYGVPIRTYPTLDYPDKQLMLDLIKEEVQELEDAIAAGNIVEVFDALLDISWVTFSGILKTGLPFSEGIEEVARSNRTKLGLDGLPIYSATNKVLKGPNFTPPDLQKVLDAPQRNSKSSR